MSILLLANQNQDRKENTTGLNVKEKRNSDMNMPKISR
uniref:Uncharacterized protein n=1 Tax=Arundo donax TaxID=35708 RepID=A0A0A8XWR5_ARUDO